MEFPRPGLFSLGFITGAKNAEAQSKTKQQLLGVFVPTPPLTSGSVVLVPEADVLKLEMSVADGLKFIMSLGSISPGYLAQDPALTVVAGGLRGGGLGQADGSFVSPALSPKLAGRSGLPADLNLSTPGTAVR